MRGCLLPRAALAFSIGLAQKLLRGFGCLFISGFFSKMTNSLSYVNTALKKVINAMKKVFKIQ